MAKASTNKKILLTAGVVVGLAGIGILAIRLLKKRAEKKANT